MGRKRGFDEDRMLAVIRDQFWSQGYEGTSTYDLMAATGLGKGSIYKAYGNKHELYLRTFTDYCDGIVADARGYLMLAVIRGMDCLARAGTDGGTLTATVHAALGTLHRPARA